jgi:biotin carboxylase
MKKILFIAGGIWQKTFVQYLKEKNNYVAIVNPVITSTTEICDFHVKCDINNLEEIEKYIKSEKPDLITSDQSDISTSIVSYLSHKFGLPCNEPSVIKRFTDKYEIFKFASSIEVRVPKTKLVKSLEDVLEFNCEFPIVIKPVDSTMSRGFSKINCPRDINEKLLVHSLKFSKSKTLIAQEFIDGDMVTLEGVCSGSKHKTLAVSRKRKENYFKSGIVSDVRYPADYEKNFLDKIVFLNDKYIEESGMRFGLTHSEFIVKNGDIYLIESGARGGGAGIASEIVPWVSGVDSYSIFYKSLLGEIIDVKSLKLKQRSALLRYYRKEDVDEDQAKKIKRLEGCKLFSYNFTGTQYQPDKNDCRYSMAIYLSENDDEMKIIQEKVNAIIKKQ